MIDRAGKQGIALVIVLGFLSILTIMAVGFAISMRTESLVSAAHSESISARQFASTAMARALLDIESSVSTNCYPNFTAGDSAFADVLYVSGGAGAVDDPDLSGMIEYVPGALSNDVASASADAGWKVISDAEGVAIGRISYVVANCSGFLDANYVQHTNRCSGRSTAEIVPITGGDIAHDFSDDSSASNCFSTVGNKWKKLVDQREVAHAYSSFENGKDMPDYLFPFSYSPARTNDIPVVLDQTDDGIYHYLDLAGQPADLPIASAAGNDQPDWVDAYAAGLTINGALFPQTVRTNLVQMIAESGARELTGSDPSTDPSYNSFGLWNISHRMADQISLYNAGLGFRKHAAGWYANNFNASDNYFLQPFYMPSMQQTALFSELWVNCTDMGGGLSFLIEVEMEFINPYSVPIDVVDKYYSIAFNAGKYDEITATTDGLETNSVALPATTLEKVWVSHDGTASGTLSKQNSLLSEANDGRPRFDEGFGYTDGMMPAGDVRRISFEIECSFVVVPEAIAFNDIAVLHTSYRPLYCNTRLGSSTDSKVIWDGTTTYEKKWSAFDPRVFAAGKFNYASRYAFTSPPAEEASVSDDFPAKEAIDEFGDPANTPDGTVQMYYPDMSGVVYSPRDSVAFLGRFPMSKTEHFCSIPLVGTNAVDVMAFFSVTNVWPDAGGRININSPYRDVLAAGFKAANTDMSGVDANYEPLSQDDALGLADLILQQKATQPDQCFTNMVQVWRSATRQEFESALGGKNKFEVEEIIARSQRLFTARQQLFTIYVTAQSLNHDLVAGESTAVAVVWRDPDLDERGMHPVKVLAFSYLQD